MLPNPLFASRLILLVLIVAFGKSLSAQFLFPESFVMIPLDTNRKIVGNVGGSFNQQTQINVVTQFAVRAEVAKRIKSDVLTLVTNNQLIRDGAKNILGGGYFFARYRRKIPRVIYPEYAFQAQWKEVRGLQQRWSATANYRWRIKRNEKITLAAAAGIIAEYEKWEYDGVPIEKRPADLTPVEVFNPRFNWYFSYDHTISPKVWIDAAVYYQVRLGETLLSRERTGMHARVGVRLSQNLSFMATWKGLYDKEPVVPVGKLWYNMNNELVFTF